MQADDRAGGVVVGEGDVGADDDHVGVGGGLAGQRIGIGLAVAPAVIQPCRLVVLVRSQVGGIGRLVADDHARRVLAAGEARFVKQEGFGLGGYAVFLLHLVHEHGDVVRGDVVLVVGADVPLVDFLVHQLHVGVGELAVLAVFLHPVLDAGGTALIAEEVVRRFPHLGERGHGDARGADRTGHFRILAQEQRNLTGGTVLLNGQLIDEVGGGHAPVRQRAGVGVDVDEYGAVAAGPAFAGNGVHAVLDGVVAGDFHGDFGGAVVLGLAQLLRLAGYGEAGLADVKRRAGRERRQTQHGGQEKNREFFVHGFLLVHMVFSIFCGEVVGSFLYVFRRKKPHACFLVL